MDPMHPLDPASESPPTSPASGAGQQSNPTWKGQDEQTVRFTGTTGEYFRIWAVNLCLNIVTLGLYSSWAKVRTKQYFTRHTFVGDHSFDYLADPFAIFKGRLVMGAFFVALGLSQTYSPLLYLALLLVFMFASPWLLVKAMAFNARNHAFRNVRFRFSGTTGESYTMYLKGMLIYLFTLGLGYPYFQYIFVKFLVENSAYGDKEFRFKSSPGDYFIAFLIALVGYFPTMLFIGLGFGVMVAGMGESPMLAAVGGGLILVGYLCMIIPIAILQAHMANLMWGGIELGNNTFLESNQLAFDLFKMHIVHLFALVFSLGLAMPWVRIRLARYRANSLTVHNASELVAQVQHAADEDAYGDAASDFGDFGLDLG